MTNRVVHFDFAVDDPDRATKFWEEAFGWKVTKWDSSAMDYWLVMTGSEDDPGIDGGLALRQEGTPNTEVTLDVEDVAAAVAKVEAAGGTVVVPPMPIPGVGYLAYCLDTEGNRFGLMTSDPSAGA